MVRYNIQSYISATGMFPNDYINDFVADCIDLSDWFISVLRKPKLTYPERMNAIDKYKKDFDLLYCKHAFLYCTKHYKTDEGQNYFYMIVKRGYSKLIARIVTELYAYLGNPVHVYVEKP